MLKKVFLLGLLIYIFNDCILAQDWETYPYYPQGSVIYFPLDEGRHPSEQNEWWYTVAHVKGATSGIDYSFMLTYIYGPGLGFDGLRYFNISDETNGQFYSQTLPCNYSNLAQNHLNIRANPAGSAPEEWITLQDSLGVLIPFQYHLTAASQNGAIDLYYDTMKRPLIVGETGLFPMGSSGYTYYYSQTMLDVSGTLTFNNITEQVTGTAWIDRQYGNLTLANDKGYEWFCVQLSNGMDLNFWTIFNEQNQIPNSSAFKLCNIYINDSTFIDTSNFDLSRLKYAFMPDSGMCYSQQWRLIVHNMDLTINTEHLNCEVFKLNSQRFYEGSTIVHGIVNNEEVTGVGFAELSYSYSNPDIKIISPNVNEIWDGSKAVTWRLLNPDEGRPIYYNLEYSLDNGTTFSTIVQGLQDTLYHWNLSGIAAGTNCWLRVIGYSIDTTLIGMNESDNSFIIGSVRRSEFEYPIVKKYELNQNYPNPFNPTTTIVFKLPKTTNVILKVFNITGEEVTTLVSKNLYSGKHTYNWNASYLASGVYFYKLETEDFVQIRKMVLLQ